MLEQIEIARIDPAGEEVELAGRLRLFLRDALHDGEHAFRVVADLLDLKLGVCTAMMWISRVSGTSPSASFCVRTMAPSQSSPITSVEQVVIMGMTRRFG